MPMQKRLPIRAVPGMDSGNQVASKSSKYGKRLAKIAKALGNDSINGTPVSYKVYMTSDVNTMGDGERRDCSPTVA